MELADRPFGVCAAERYPSRGRQACRVEGGTGDVIDRRRGGQQHLLGVQVADRNQLASTWLRVYYFRNLHIIPEN